MKVWKWKMGAALVFGLALVPAEAAMREFSLADGRAVEAEIVGFNAKNGQVELLLANGQRKKVDASIFVAGDQQYIKDWAALEGFRNPSSFKVECKKNKVESWKEEDEWIEKKLERYVFEVYLENRTDVGIENLTAEYRIFYEQEANEQGGKISKADKVEAGKLDIERLRAKEKRTETTGPVVIYGTDFNLTDYYVPDGDPQKARGEIKGIWIKLTTKTAGGETQERNVYDPASIEGKYTWPKSAEPAERETKKGRKKG